MNNIGKRLKERLKGKVVIAGMGNSLKGDDGLGPQLIKRLKGKTKAHLVDTGIAPENYTGKIASLKPDTILLIDACDLGKIPGAMRLVETEEIKNTGCATHSLAPSVFMNYLKQAARADIFMLAVQPGNLDLGEVDKGYVEFLGFRLSNSNIARISLFTQKLLLSFFGLCDQDTDFLRLLLCYYFVPEKDLKESCTHRADRGS